MAEFQLTDLWKGIYEQERVASKIIEIAAKKEEGITFQLDGFGEVKLVIKAASGLGDNYMSDTYYNTAILSDGAHYKAFVKVLKTRYFIVVTQWQRMSKVTHLRQ